MDAVLVADAEVNEYRTFIRKGMFGSLLGEKEKYTDLIETLWFHLGESSEKITENYHVFLPSYIWRIVSAGRRKKQNSRTWDILPAVSVWRSFGREIRPDPRLNGRTRPFTGLRKPEETAS